MSNRRRKTSVEDENLMMKKKLLELTNALYHIRLGQFCVDFYRG